MQNVSQEAVKELPLLLPPPNEQLQIVSHLERAGDEVSALVEQAELSITLLQERRAALISAAVTGKIDVRNYIPRPTPSPKAMNESA